MKSTRHHRARAILASSTLIVVSMQVGLWVSNSAKPFWEYPLTLESSIFLALIAICSGLLTSQPKFAITRTIIPALLAWLLLYLAISQAGAWFLTGKPFWEARDLPTGSFLMNNIALFVGVFFAIYAVRVSGEAARRFWITCFTFAICLFVGAGLAASTMSPASFEPPTKRDSPTMLVLVGSGVEELGVKSINGQSFQDFGLNLTGVPAYYVPVGTHHVSLSLKGSPGVTVNYAIVFDKPLGYRAESPEAIYDATTTSETTQLGNWGKTSGDGVCRRNDEGSSESFNAGADSEIIRGSLQLNYDGLASVRIKSTESIDYGSTVQARTYIFPAQLSALTQTSGDWCLAGSGALSGDWVPPNQTILSVGDPLYGFFGQDPRFDIQRSNTELYKDGSWNMQLPNTQDVARPIFQDEDLPSSALESLHPYLVAIDPSNAGRVASFGFFAAILLGLALGCLVDFAYHWPSNSKQETKTPRDLRRSRIHRTTRVHRRIPEALRRPGKRVRRNW